MNAKSSLPMLGIGSVSTFAAPTTARPPRRMRALRRRLVVDGRRVAPLVADRRRHLERRGDAGDDSRIRRSIRSCTSGLERADRAAQHDFLRDHVPGVAAVHLRDADDTRVERMQVARDDRLQRVDRVRDERASGPCRCRPSPACAPLPVRDDLEDVERAHQRPGAHRHRAERLLRPVVHRRRPRASGTGRRAPPRP